jgi:predicted helicase
VDKRIKNTYIKNSTAQKTKQYDMYKRFIRWASDRIAQDGIIAFIVNRSFIDKRQDDGFRKIIENEFDNCFIIELGGDIRASKEAKGNIFDIKLGVAIVFLVKKEKNKIKKCRIEYFAVNDSDSKLEKLNFLKDNKLEYLNFNLILPDNNNNWINLTDNDWNTLIPLCNNETKQAKTKDKECAVFKQFTNGVATNRDEWVFDLNSKNLENKICFFIEKYNDLLKNKDNTWDISIKWSETLKRKFISRKKINFSKKSITQLYYRPFCKQYYYSEKNLSDRLTQNHFEVFGKDLDKKNATIIFRGTSPLRDFSCLASNIIFDLHVGDGNSGFQCISNCLIDNNGKQTLNITNWGVQQFSSHYKNEKISETNIFYYVYAVLHNPAYRTKYENNLKRELPRIPFYTDFWRWSKWGEKLIQLHTEYEAIKPDKELKIKNYELGIEKPKAKLKIDKTNNEIIIDEITTIQNIPASVWDYKLGNRSAVEWILDQYKEKNPEHETIKEKFNNYKFSDYKLHVIDLILRVSTVSIETMKIINEMKNKTE